MAQYAQFFSSIQNSLYDIRTKIGQLEEKVQILQGVEKRDVIVPEWVEKTAFNEIASNVKTIEVSVLQLSKDLKAASQTTKDDIARERQSIENGLMLKLEHFVSKCVKERLELGIQSMRQVVDEKINSAVGEAISKLPPPPPPQQTLVVPIPTPLPDLISEPAPALTYDTTLDIDALTKDFQNPSEDGDQSDFGIDFNSATKKKGRPSKKV